MSSTYKEVILEKITNNKQWIRLFEAAINPDKYIIYNAGFGGNAEIVPQPYFENPIENYSIIDKPIPKPKPTTGLLTHWVNFYKNGNIEGFKTKTRAIQAADEKLFGLIRSAVHMEEIE